MFSLSLSNTFNSHLKSKIALHTGRVVHSTRGLFINIGYYAALSIGDRIKWCIPSVRPVSPIFSKFESCRNFQFSGNIAMDKSNWENKFKV